MVTTAIAAQSYPAKGDQGFSVEQWAEMYNSPDAIIEDFSTGAFAMTRIDGSSTVRIGAAGDMCKVNGYALKLTGPVDFIWPNPGQVQTLLVAAMYDPALNVAVSGTDQADPAGPCRLVFTTDALVAGKSYLPLWTLARGVIDSLSQAVPTDHRRWTGPHMQVNRFEAAIAGIPSSPRGSTIYERGTNCTFERTLNAGGTGLQWLNLDRPAAIPFPADSNLVSRDTDDNSAPQMVPFARVMIQLRGTLKRTTGNLSNGSNVLLGRMPVGARPAFDMRFSCRAGGNSQVEVRIDASSGDVVMFNPPSPVEFVDLSSIIYRMEQ